MGYPIIGTDSHMLPMLESEAAQESDDRVDAEMRTSKTVDVPGRHTQWSRTITPNRHSKEELPTLWCVTFQAEHNRDLERREM